jgi:hypothetical protein
MMNRSDVTSQNRYARMAGLMYLVVIGAYILGDSIRSRIEVDGNFIESAHRILQSEHMYRVGLCVQLAEMLLTLWLAVGLYVTVRPLNRNLAIAALSSRMAEVILGGGWIVLQFAWFYCALAANHESALSPTQLSQLGELCARASSAVYNASAIFFGMGSTVFF